MSDNTNTRILLNSRPKGMFTENNFKLDRSPIPQPGHGEMLIKTLWLSLDPYMRGRMNDQQSYATPLQLNDVMTAGIVGEVIESNIEQYRAGDLITGMYGWQQYAIAKADDSRLFKVDPDNAPISTAVGVTGMPGQTAYFGLLKVGEPSKGETVVVSAASGAVGSAVGQIAKIKGCHVVGIAGGPKKCTYVKDELGFDACIDYKAGNLAEDLKAACPHGIDIYFENVGGPVLKAVTPLLNEGARVPICGFISAYNAVSMDEVESPFDVLGALSNPPFHRFFVVTEWLDEFPAAVKQLGDWIKQGKLKYRETVVEGIENAPAAFRMLFTGENFGKLMIKVAERGA